MIFESQAALVKLLANCPGIDVLVAAGKNSPHPQPLSPEGRGEKSQGVDYILVRCDLNAVRSSSSLSHRPPGENFS